MGYGKEKNLSPLPGTEPRSSSVSHAGSSNVDFSTLKMEAIRSSETSVHTRSTWRDIPEDGILQENR
jgi:hypothetical protein